MRSNLVQLGRTIRAKRTALGMTLQDVAEKADITRGLVSKIENFRTVPSLPILLRLAAALDVTMADLVKGIHTGDPYSPYILITSDQREEIQREDSEGFTYESIMEHGMTGVSSFQSFILTMAPDAKRAPVSTDGDQFVYMLSGSISFDIGEETVSLNTGDTLFFDGALPHCPINRSGTDAILLVIYLVRGA